MRSVRIPANIDQDDKLLAGLSARQLVLVVVPLVLLWMLYSATRSVLPITVFGPIAIVVAGTAVSVALVRRDGISMDRFAMHAIRFARAKHQLVNVTEDVPLPDGIERFGLPVRSVSASGVVDLGDDGSAVVCELSAINLSLQSEPEQEALTGAFGRYCNSLTGSVQVVVRSEPIDVSSAVVELRAAASQLPTVGLEHAAQKHASHLNELGSRKELLRRRVLLVIRESGSGEQAETALMRSAADAVTALRIAGVHGRLLDGDAVTCEIQRAASPEGYALPAGGEDVVTRSAG